MLTIAKLVREANAHGMTVTHRDGEYRVAYKGKGNEASAYYTNDRQDALDTMRVMIKYRDAQHAERSW